MVMRANRWLLLALRVAPFLMVSVWAQAVNGQTVTSLDNETCLGCHGVPGFTMPRPGGSARSLFASVDQLASSVHGKALRCVDCHTTITELPHTNVSKTPAEWDRARLAINKNCINCHGKAAQGYTETYHGQVITMGFASGATCSDCHGSHAVLRSSDPASSVAPANLLKTCQTCHRDATRGFATFQSHATTDDFAHYPYTWIASKFVNLAVGGVLLFFWLHSALWFYREYRDRREQILRPHVRTEGLPQGESRHIQRWGAMWRWAHLLFALSIILLVATGVTLLYPNTAWAPILERAMGGPEIAGLLHRVAAVVMVAVFAWHIIYAAIHIAQNWKTFKVFGPYSLMPNWQDAADFGAMFKWFFGRRPRPTFDHWNYQQKVDYWAPFWGIAMLVTTGAMLWFKSLTAAYLPGWVFNVATVAHGDEALLAATYLFTVHYFVNHWRPDKFPLDVVMFTGSMPLEEFRREFAVEYYRLVKTGQLQKHLVDAPSRPMTLGSKILGFGLVAVGLALFIMMLIGFGSNLTAG
jgi:cytochrome b subunit of formate dehydrogenase